MKLFVFAMESEAKDVLADFKCIEKKPFSIYKKDNCLVTITGIGKVNAAMVLTNILTRFKIEHIYNLGFAGIFSDKYKIGDLLEITNAKYHDFDLTVFGYKLGQVPNMPAIYKSNIISDHPKIGLLTGDYFMTNKPNQETMVDMEGAALYQVAHLFGKKISSFKIVSDIIGKSSVKDYREFESKGSLYFKKIVDNLL